MEYVAGIASCVTDAFCDRVDSCKLNNPLIRRCYEGAEMPSFLCTDDSELFFFGCVPTALHPLYSLASHAAFPEGSGVQGLVIRDRLVSEGP